MLLYKIEEHNMDKSGDYQYMINLVNKDYRNYFKASNYLQNRYDFSIQAIYSCLSEVNHIENKKIAYEILLSFLNEIKRINGINMQIVHKDMFYVKEKPKVKVKRYQVRRAS